MALRQTLFGFEGSTDRRTYWTVLLALLVVKALILVAILFWGLVQEWYYFNLAGYLNYRLIGWIGCYALSLEITAWTWAWAANNVKRLRTIGWSPWWTLLTFVPIIPPMLWVLGQ